MKEWKDENPANGPIGAEPTPRGERPPRAQHAWLEVNKARSATSALCTGRSGAACSAVSRGAKPARRGGLQSRPLEWGAVGLSTKSSKKGLRPCDYMSPFSAIDRTAGPATIM